MATEQALSNLTLPRIPLCEPCLRGNEWRNVKECLDTNWVSSVGPFVGRFEEALARCTGAGRAVATASGSAALHVALKVAGVEADDEVLVPALTFIAPANAVRMLGAWPVFIDVEPRYWQLDPEKTAGFLQKECAARKGRFVNKSTGRRVKALLPVHLLGHPCDMDPLCDLTRRYGLAIVEDAAESLGAKYKHRPIGRLGDIACLSFNGNKIVTTGGGGAVLTDNEAWARKARYLITQAKDDPLEYIHNEIGFNYRLTSLQAAVGIAQLEKLAQYIERKRQIAAAYAEAFHDVPGLSVMQEAPWAFGTFWLYTILVDPAAYGMGSRDLLRRLDQGGIQSRPLWQPMHRSPAHAASQCWQVEVADNLYRNALSLPCSVGLTAEQQERVIQAVARH